ncbi:MAG: succinylglutamate desuccinylase/aspartoacylase family protein [Thermoplasmatota archaeon]
MRDILITAGVHGDEFGSVLVARELKGWVEGKGIQNVDILPNVNLRALESWQRENPKDMKDLNREFPGKENGTSTERTANELFKKAKQYDCVIDLHTYGDKSRCIPYMLTDLDKKYNIELCKNVGIEYGVQTGGDSGQMFLELSNRGIPSMIIEAGGSHYLSEKIMSNVLHNLKEFILDVEREKSVKFFPKYTRYSPDLKGSYIPKKKPGDTVKKGDVLGYLEDEPVFSEHDGFILGIKMRGEYDHEEESLAAIAFEDD